MESPFKIISNGDVSTGHSESPSKTQTRVSPSIKYSRAEGFDLVAAGLAQCWLRRDGHEVDVEDLAFVIALDADRQGLRYEARGREADLMRAKRPGRLGPRNPVWRSPV